jgi:hypothetical protein
MSLTSVIPPAKTGKPRILIMSPKGGSSEKFEGAFKACVDAVCAADLPYEFIPASITGAGIGMARNILTHHAVTAGVDGILTWDRDISLPGKSPGEWVKAIMRLLSWPVEIGNVAALYSVKSEDSARWVITPLPNEKRQKDGLLKVFEAGTGLKLIWMWQIKAMMKAFPELAYTSDTANYGEVLYDLFSMGVVAFKSDDGGILGSNRRYLSEDYYFDYRLRTMGFPIWVDTNVQTKHRGETPDGRVLDFPTYPLALPGLAPDADVTQSYAGEMLSYPTSIDVDRPGMRSIAYYS